MGKIARIIFGLLLAGCAASAQAQTYPDRPIRLIVSIAAGSVTDVIMRKAAVELQPRLGASRSSSRTAAAPAASSRRRPARRPRPTAIRCA